jgi:hypothetical protein
MRAMRPCSAALHVHPAHRHKAPRCAPILSMPWQETRCTITAARPQQQVLRAFRCVSRILERTSREMSRARSPLQYVRRDMHAMWHSLARRCKQCCVKPPHVLKYGRWEPRLCYTGRCPDMHPLLQLSQPDQSYHQAIVFAVRHLGSSRRVSKLLRMQTLTSRLTVHVRRAATSRGLCTGDALVKAALLEPSCMRPAVRCIAMAAGAFSSAMQQYSYQMVLVSAALRCKKYPGQVSRHFPRVAACDSLNSTLLRQPGFACLHAWTPIYCCERHPTHTHREYPHRFADCSPYLCSSRGRHPLRDCIRTPKPAPALAAPLCHCSRCTVTWRLSSIQPSSGHIASTPSQSLSRWGSWRTPSCPSAVGPLRRCRHATAAQQPRQRCSWRRGAASAASTAPRGPSAATAAPPPS